MGTRRVQAAAQLQILRPPSQNSPEPNDPGPTRILQAKKRPRNQNSKRP